MSFLNTLKISVNSGVTNSGHKFHNETMSVTSSKKIIKNGNFKYRVHSPCQFKCKLKKISEPF